MKNLLILLFFLLPCATTQAQQPGTVGIETEQMADKSIRFMAKKPEPGIYTLYIRFGVLTNCTSSLREQKFILKDSGCFLTLRPSNPEFPIGCDFSYTYYKGAIDAVPYPDFVYRIPLSPLKKTTASRIHNLKKGSGQPPYIGFSLSANEGDTVYAARRGVVIAAGAEYHVITNPDQYGFSIASIVVEHADGSIAEYATVDQQNIFVSEGDTVNPDTALALVGSRNGMTASVDLFLYTYFFPDPARQQISWKIFEGSFATDKGAFPLSNNMTYRPEVTQELITREMPKREARKYKK